MSIRHMHGFILALTVAASGVALGQGRNPTGETANYPLDTDPNRTSSMIQSGSMVGSIADHKVDAQGNPYYVMDLNYDFNVFLEGEKKGTETIGVPDAYYTPQFMPALRSSGHYTSPEFDMDYLGAENASTKDGHTYANCDKVKIYNINQNAAIARIARALFAIPEGDSIDNLVVVADIYPGVPVIGAVKIDMTGVYSGMNIKAGADYAAP